MFFREAFRPGKYSETQKAWNSICLLIVLFGIYESLIGINAYTIGFKTQNDEQIRKKPFVRYSTGIPDSTALFSFN